MALRFQILGSGSSGNCALLRTDESCVLIDAGFSARRLRQMLHEASVSIEEVDAIFITHEHGDHTAGIDGLKKHTHLRYFANSPTARAIQGKLSHSPNWQLFETGSRFSFRDLSVETFSVPHDAQEPVGYVFTHGHGEDLFNQERRLIWLTDLGHVPTPVRERLRDVDIVAIESNHCVRLLEADVKRPWPTKQRISGRHGHLSNDGMRELLESIASPRWKHIFLTHVSRDCNSIEAIEQSLGTLRARLSCPFSIIKPGEGSLLHEFI